MRAAKGEGSVFKVGDGYRGYVLVNGKRKWYSAKTKTEAAQKKRELLTRRDDGRLVTGKVPTLGAWMTHWLENVTKVRPTTHAMHRWVIEQKIIPELGLVRLDALTAERIEQWVTDLGVSPSSQRRYLAPMRAALEVAFRRGHITFNPASRIQLAPQGRAQTSSFSGADRDAILAQAKGQNAARWHIALKMGLRPGEALGLTWPDFDEETGRLTIRNQLLQVRGVGLILQPEPKTAAGERRVKLPRYLVEMLKAHRMEQLEQMSQLGDEWRGWEFNGEPVALIFAQPNGRPWGTTSDVRAWHKLLSAAGISDVRRYKARHTAATHMIVDSGGDVAVTAKMLGHADASFTYRTYVHPLEAREDALAEKMNAAYGAAYVESVGEHQETIATSDPSNGGVFERP